MPAANDTSAPTLPSPTRLTSLDAYRGFVMFLMMAEVLNLCDVSSRLGKPAFWNFLCHHQSHVAWVGCSLHDLIQPSFSFLVGVALPFSIASRVARGQAWGRMTLHAFWRALLLILLGVFLRSTGARVTQTNWTFEDTLSQIGLGYPLLFLLGLGGKRIQWTAFVAIIVGYWLAFVLYPAPAANFDWTTINVAKDWEHNATALASHWNKNTNLAWAFDKWFLNLFPRENPFAYNGGGYATLSFIPTLATMILGLIVGGVLRSERTPWQRVKWFCIAGVLGLALGAAADWFGVCPLVKKIWTPGWVLFSGGWCFLLLAGFYAAIDIAGVKRWAFPLTVIGMNSIAAYCMAHLFDGFIMKNLKTNLGQNFFKMFGTAYEPLVHGAATLVVLWLLLYWMYRRKIFLRI